MKNYYFIYGPTLMEVTQEYTLLTCPPELPPLWTLGYQQCKWSYFPESNVQEIAKGLRERNIPVRCHLPRHRLHGWLPVLYLAPAALS